MAFFYFINWIVSEETIEGRKLFSRKYGNCTFHYFMVGKAGVVMFNYLFVLQKEDANLIKWHNLVKCQTQVICLIQHWYSKRKLLCFQLACYFAYFRVWNRHTPLNKRSPWKIWQKSKHSPIHTLYYLNRLYGVWNKAVAPGKKSKN